MGHERMVQIELKKRMGEHGEEHKHKWFNPEINAGHLLQVAVMICGIAIFWVKLDVRVEALERQQTAQGRTLEELGKGLQSLALINERLLTMMTVQHNNPK